MMNVNTVNSPKSLSDYYLYSNKHTMPIKYNGECISCCGRDIVVLYVEFRPIYVLMFLNVPLNKVPF